MRRVSYHQSVFDLLDLEPKESARAREMIDVSEARMGRRLPEAVRQWYLIDGVVALPDEANWRERIESQRNHLWYDYSNMDSPMPLGWVLRHFENRETINPNGEIPVRVVHVMSENQAVCNWFVQVDGSDDPPVVVDEDYNFDTKQVVSWVRVADRFSVFVFDWFGHYYYKNWTPLSEHDDDPRRRTPPAREKPYLNGLWLYAPEAEPLPPPCLDYFIENLNEGPRRQIADGVMQYLFQDGDARLRVTTDPYGEEGGVSAWWLHAASDKGLLRLAERVARWAGIGKTLQSRTKSARPVMEQLQINISADRAR
jgi:hypothetical protein